MPLTAKQKLKKLGQMRIQGTACPQYKKTTKMKIQKNAKENFLLLVLSKNSFLCEREKKYLDQTDGESNSSSHHNFQVDCKNVKMQFFEDFVKIDF